MAAFLIDGVRTPRGKGREGGALNSLRPVDLLAQLYSALGERTGIEPADVDGVVLGCVTQTADQGGNIAQTSALYAGWDTVGSAVTVNSFCTSGLTALEAAACKIDAGQGEAFVVGGVECMSRVPMASDNGPLTADREVSAAIPFVPNPIIADFIAAADGLSRERLDAYAAESHRKAARATEEQRFARSLTPVKGAGGEILLDRDELIRPDASAEGMARLRPLNDPDRIASFLKHLRPYAPHAGEIAPLHHAGSAPGVVDGASLALVTSAEGAARLGRPIRARIVACSSSRGPTALGLTGAIAAARSALAKAGLTSGEIDLWEINEGFAAVALRIARELEIAEDRLNVNGGGIAMGHAMGATGVNLITTLVDELERRDLKTGVVAISGAAGVGGAVVVERLAS